MPDLVFYCDHCGVKLLGGSRRAGQDIICPKCRKQTHVPEKQGENPPGASKPASATHHGSSEPGHHHFNPVHHHIRIEHVPRSVASSTRSLALGFIGLLLVFGLAGYLSFNPNPFNPGRTRAAQHEPGQIDKNTKPPVAGQNWTSPVSGMAFVWIPSMNLWVGRYEVTNDEYLKKEPTHDSRSFQESTLCGDRQPVVYVNFDKAREFAMWLTTNEASILSGFRYRLPTVTEWITMARAGNDWNFPWGNNWPPTSGNAGNYHGQEGEFVQDKIPGYDDQHPVTCNVEDSWSNPWNIFGMGGNVWEACLSDTNKESFGGWLGGSWVNSIPERLHCTNQISQAGESGMNFGFRLVLAR